MIRDVTDLEVYEISLELMGELYTFLKKVPVSEYNSVRQCKKCATSIPANIAEGFAKKFSEAEFKRFLQISLGSSDELITHLRTISIAVPYLTELSNNLGEKYKTLSKRINSLHKSWRNFSK